MSSEESTDAGRRTRGKGRRKAGRGPADDVEDEPDSEAAEDAQRTMDEIEDDVQERTPAGAGGRGRSETGKVVDASTWAAVAAFRTTESVTEDAAEKYDDIIDRILEEVFERVDDEENRDAKP